MMSEQDRSGVQHGEDPPEVELPTVPESRGPRRGSEGRTAWAVLILLTTLVLVLPTAAAAVMLAAGPELVPDAPGGEVRLQVGKKCGTMFAEFSQTGCFEQANLTIRYGSGSSGRGQLRSTPFGWSTSITLKEARATLVVETEQGSWTREVWIIEGRDHGIQIDPSSPQEVAGVEGREVGGGLLLGMGAALGLILIITTIIWWATGSLAAAAGVRGLLTLWLIVVGVIVVVSLFLYALGIGLVLLGLWLWALRKATDGWIRRAEAEPSPDVNPDPTSSAR